MGAHGHIDLHARGHVFTQYFHHLTDGLTLLARLFDQFGNDDLSVLGLALILRRNDNVVGNALVIGNHETYTGFVKKPAHHLTGIAL